MSIASRLPFVQQLLTRYFVTTYITFGNIGLLFNIAIFSQRQHRRNPSSLYLLAASTCAFLGLNISVIPTIYQLDYTSSVFSSQLYCQLQYYFRHALNLLLRIYFIFACADRYAISSEHPGIRSFSQYKIAIRVIPAILLLFLILSIIPAMLRSIENGKCDTRSGVYAIINSIYILVFVGIIPLGSATVFSILIRNNLRKIRRRVQPVGNFNVLVNHVLRKRDRDMMRMLQVEIIFYTITTVPTVLIYLYTPFAQVITKSIDYQQTEAFIRYVTMVLLLFFTNSMSFWIYICASRSFRLEVKNLLIKWSDFITCK